MLQIARLLGLILGTDVKLVQVAFLRTHTQEGAYPRIG